VKAYGLTASAGTFLSSSENLVVAEMGGLLATIDMGRIVGGVCCAPFEGELGPNLTHCCLG